METENKQYLVIALAKAGDYKNAERLVDEIEEKAQLRALLDHAMIEHYKYNFNMAFEYLKKARDIDANNKEVLEVLAFNCEKIKDKESALGHYNKLLKMEPENIKYLQAKADLLLSLGHFGKCMEIYDKILKIDSTNIEIINAKAKLLEEMGDKQEAINWYDRLLQLSPKHPFAKEKMHKLMYKLIAYA